jgi:hypothetical protein
MDSMTDFKFVDQPPRGAGGFRRQADPLIVEFSEALRTNAGQWAEYPTPSSGERSASALAFRINRADKAPKPLRDPRFQATSSKGKVYVRFVKEGEA